MDDGRTLAAYPTAPSDKRAFLIRPPNSALIASLSWEESMNEVSVYIVERNAWSTVRQCDVHFRLTYEREFLPVQNLWRDFLVGCEETGLALAA
jgi:hypothetical protein